MASIGGIDLARADYGSGAGFFLSAHPRFQLIEAVDSNWEAELRPQNPYIVVRTKCYFASFDELEVAAHEAALQALDRTCVVGNGAFTLRNYPSEYILWWSGADGLIVRVVTFTVQEARVGRASATVRAADGTIVPPSPTPPFEYHESMRYFRISQASSDLFDSFRNLWLAFESILSKHYPKRKNERELDWLRRAIACAAQSIPFEGRTHPDYANRLVKRLYECIRIRLFHAKDGRKVLRPLSLADRQTVLEGHAELSKIVLKLFAYHQNARFLGGWINPELHSKAAREYLPTLSVVMSDYDGSLEEERVIEGLATANKVKMESELLPSREVGREALISVASAREFGDIESVRTLVAFQDDKPAIYSDLEAKLLLEGVERFECVLGSSMINGSLPRANFAS